MKPKRYYVKWRDACSEDNGERKIDEVKPSLCIWETIGFLVHQDSTYLVLSQSCVNYPDADGDHFRVNRMMTIPKAWVIKKRVLK